MDFIVFDTEDDNATLEKKARGKVILSGKRVTQIAALTSNGDSYYSKGNVRSFIRWLRDRDERYIYAHNLQYDLGNLFAEQLDALNWTLIGSRLIRAEWGGKVLRDSLNMFPMRLEQLGISIGLRKLEFAPDSKEYVFRDVEILKRALEMLLKLVRAYGLEELPSTLGGLCIKLWKVMGGTNWFTDDQVYRDCYFGGRVEPFRRRAANVTYVDVNSLYPWAMTHEFPEEVSQQKDIDCLGCAEAMVKVPQMFVTPLPIRTEEHVIYPVGKIKGIWTTTELQTAVNAGCRIDKLHWVLGSKRGQFFYRDFVQEFYKRRQETKDEGLRLFHKLLMNNLYGQLATTGDVDRTVDVKEKGCYMGQQFGKKMLVNTKVPLPEHVNVLHAAMITSIARARLFGFMRQLDETRLIYCDTDSIFYEGSRLLPISGKLGDLKLEAEKKTCHVIGPKCYVLGNDYKAKGVPKHLAKEFIRHGRVSWYQPNKLRRAIKSFDKGNIHKLAVWELTGKEIATVYDRKNEHNGRFFPKVIDNRND